MISKDTILKKIASILLHAIFWVVVLFSYTYFFGYNTNDISYVFSFSLFLMPVTIGTTYAVTDILIPKYLINEKYILFIIYCIYTIIISTFFIVISFFYGLIFLSSLKYEGMAPMTRSPFFLFIAVYFVVFIASALNLAQHNYKSRTANQELKNRILEAQLKLKEQELNYLKMQIHPHFLFNTLNTLYGFALEKSDDTPEMILKLSNLLDYLLYQSDKPLVSLQEEINHIEDYVALEKMRFSDVLDISLQVENIKNTIQIAPMLLIPFVENSFKHGQIVDQKLSIYIHLKYIDNEIHFLIKNSIHSFTEKSKKGIGLNNIKKRLSLVYRDNHELTVLENQNWYTVQLILKNLKAPTNEF
ncbi:histidine kinase [Aquimarina sp. AD1]|uniref:sensor histidine kinase n=1 Tax=Aquimarina sp. (strain AD1) TaxID=1714848 RepID=UPI000E51DA8F|nr:histidine kinase [Aquimarina sp. AD1]AXT54840.1 histidine kinase [Aquimarina sp. AD1]RKN16374.1 histidine kinase [Aquimarina sp. AD1]